MDEEFDEATPPILTKGIGVGTSDISFDGSARCGRIRYACRHHFRINNRRNGLIFMIIKIKYIFINKKIIIILTDVSLEIVLNKILYHFLCYSYPL